MHRLIYSRDIYARASRNAMNVFRGYFCDKNWQFAKWQSQQRNLAVWVAWVPVLVHISCRQNKTDEKSLRVTKYDAYQEIPTKDKCNMKLWEDACAGNCWAEYYSDYMTLQWQPWPRLVAERQTCDGDQTMENQWESLNSVKIFLVAGAIF